ncbi:hypothetical protein EVAR_88968_1 [Eumeta japonica]|uniref:Uncharacterized protein n=1 Tax=Eumeta variegata TaxID=151549 RepID=A0A4C1VRB4_EUMVA|nr:hypothetical protein EVAR_88968_1 [Eumeta japonica]
MVSRQPSSLRNAPLVYHGPSRSPSGRGHFRRRRGCAMVNDSQDHAPRRNLERYVVDISKRVKTIASVEIDRIGCSSRPAENTASESE